MKPQWNAFSVVPWQTNDGIAEVFQDSLCGAASKPIAFFLFFDENRIKAKV